MTSGDEASPLSTLDDAWRWYKNVERVLGVARRLGAKHWDNLPWDGPLSRDDRLRDITALQLIETANNGLGHLDDVAVFVLFSVFESTVRDWLRTQFQGLIAVREHFLLVAGVRTMTDRVENGAFAELLELTRVKAGTDLLEEVNQVRRYRNWVAHGRRGDVENNVTPQLAYDRLNRFLAKLNDREQ